MKLFLKAGLAAAALFVAAPASAQLVPVGGANSCATVAPTGLASYQGCAGAYAGNLNNASQIGNLNLALDALMGGSYSPDVVWADLDPLKITIASGSVVNFGSALLGQVILSAHFGDGGSGWGDHTILYLFNFTSPTSSVDLGRAGLSNVVPIAPIPEPATWAMMLLGFGAMGLMIRRSRRRQQPMLQLA